MKVFRSARRRSTFRDAARPGFPARVDTAHRRTFFVSLPPLNPRFTRLSAFASPRYDSQYKMRARCTPRGKDARERRGKNKMDGRRDVRTDVAYLCEWYRSDGWMCPTRLYETASGSSSRSSSKTSCSGSAEFTQTSSVRAVCDATFPFVSPRKDLCSLGLV